MGQHFLSMDKVLKMNSIDGWKSVTKYSIELMFTNFMTELKLKPRKILQSLIIMFGKRKLQLDNKILNSKRPKLLKYIYANKIQTG